MSAKIKLALAGCSFEAEGNEEFVAEMYNQFKLDLSELQGVAAPTAASIDIDPTVNDHESEENTVDEALRFSEFFALREPSTDKHKALLAIYWLIVRVGQETASGYEINKMLKELGHQIPNVTNAIAPLMKSSPALVVQEGKGAGKKGRKSYRITIQGRKQAESMIKFGEE